MTAIHDTALAVANALGAEWTAKPMHDHAAKLTGGTVEIFARVETYGANKDRIEWTPSYPNGAYDHIRYMERAEAFTKTSTAPERDPKAIARQIRRTVLPAAEKFTAVVADRMGASENARQRRAAAFAEVQTILPGAHSRTQDFDNDISLYPGGDWYGHVRINHDASTGTVELHGLPWAAVLQILAIANGGE